MVSIRKRSINKTSSFCSPRNVIFFVILCQAFLFLFRGSGNESSDIMKTMADYEHKVEQQFVKNQPVEIKKVTSHLPDEPEPLKLQSDADHHHRIDKDESALPHVAVEQPHPREEHLEQPATDDEPEVKPVTDEHNTEEEAPPKLETFPPVKKEVATKPESALTQLEGGPDHQIVLKKHGTGPTILGYVNDFDHDRTHASFRQQALPAKNRNAKVVASLIGEKESAVHECEYIQDRRWQEHDVCRDDDTTLVAYNGGVFPKFLCGHAVLPSKAIKLEEHCAEPVHLSSLEADAPLNGNGVQAIVVQPKPGATMEDKLRIIQCDIPCRFHEDALRERQIYVSEADWTIKRTWDDPALNLNAQVEPTAYRRNTFYSTSSFESSVPLTSYDFDKYNLRKAAKLDFDQMASRATYLLDSKCTVNTNRRHKWYAAVSKAMETEAYGSCHHNADLSAGETLATVEGRRKLYQKNRIALIFETGGEKDHITEQVWEALMSGTVPAILGAANVGIHLPRHSAIIATDYNDWDKFAAYIKNVATKKDLWDSYHAWRTDEQELAAFEARYEFARVSPECRLCRWAYSKQNGLGWNHEKQIVQENHIRRKLCLGTDSKRIVSPFQERWMGQGSEHDVSKEKCYGYGTAERAELAIDGLTIHRTVTHHDGVTDVIIESIEGQPENVLRLQLQIPISNSEGAIFVDAHTLVGGSHSPLVSSAALQDDHSKVTVMVNWETIIRSPREGALELLVPTPTPSQQILRIRVIPEDMDDLHDTVTAYFPSAFAKRMMQDFMDPLEVYYIGNERN